MINEELIKFLEYSKDKEDVKEKLAQVSSPQEIVEYAKELGFEFTTEDLKQFGEELMKQKDELTDEELEKIAGGAVSLSVAVAIALLVGVGLATAGATAALAGVAGVTMASETL